MSLPPKIKPASVVNAYLFYAQRLLQNENQPPLNAKTQADKLALFAGIDLCLVRAWQAWLDELGTYLNKRFSSYTDMLLPEHINHPEIQILKDIQAQPKNWLSRLFLCFEPRINTLAQVNEEDGRDHDSLAYPVERPGSMIQLVQVEAQPEMSESQQLLQTIQAFRRYIESVRIRQAEW